MTGHRRPSVGMSLALLLPFLLAGCVSVGGGPPGPHPTAPLGGGPPSAVTVASFNFPESELLAQIYGQRFKRFFGLDTGGPLTLQALRAGDIDVGLLFSTDPGIERYHLVVLSDDRDLQPAENVTPVIRSAMVSRYGPGLVRVVNEVSARLTTDELRGLNARAALPSGRPRHIGAQWLAGRGL